MILIQEPDMNPTPQKPTPGQLGWIAPNGDFYPCPYHYHATMAEALDSSEQSLEYNGWIKITGLPPFTVAMIYHFRPSAPQGRTIKALGLEFYPSEHLNLPPLPKT